VRFGTLILALFLTEAGFAQSDNRLLGKWSCATRETAKDITGRTIGDVSVGKNTLEFRSDQTALVRDVTENARWSGGANKLTLQVGGGPSFTGSVNKAGVLSLRASQRDRDRDILHAIEWTCTK